jgi:hypothetical protein
MEIGMQLSAVVSATNVARKAGLDFFPVTDRAIRGAAGADKLTWR